MGGKPLDPRDVLFPFDRPRPIQEDLLADMHEAITAKKGILAHAPTGLGKTVASIAPALRHAIDNNLTVFFLTSRHTQHQIAINTLRDIRERYGINFTVADMIGKKHMCSQPGVSSLYTSEFYEYCKAVREEGRCAFYANTRQSNGRLTTEGRLAVEEIARMGPSHVEEAVKACGKSELCPYEVVSALASKAQVIVTDYFYLFHPTIRESFFKRTKKSLDTAIIIVDEGHNLPARLRELMSTRLSTFMVRRAVKEVKKHGYGHVIPILTALQDRLNTLSEQMNVGDEKRLTKQHLAEAFSSEEEYREAADALSLIADHILQEQKRSAVHSIAAFLEAWSGPDEGFARILSMEEVQRSPIVTLMYRCLDPSLMTVDVVHQAYSLIIMSGTLMPLEMYRDLLGMGDAMLRKYPSPFPPENRLALISTTATTQYKVRGPEQYSKMAGILAGIVNLVPGNSAAFFPSYSLRDEVNRLMQPLCEKTTFLETSDMTKEDKADLFERFASYQKTGAVLMGVASGSFAEGIDFKGDLLKAVVVVGLPLQRPDMETKCLIEYYDKKFGKGWDYGYVYPAMNRVLQAAGRCIRSEKDRGAIIFLDMRFAWPNYLQCLPRQEWGIHIAKHPEDCFARIEGFFGEKHDND